MKRKDKRPKGVLLIVTGLFMASGVLRLGDEAGQVWASGTDTTATHTSEVTVADGETCETPANLSNLLAAFQTREERLREGEGQLLDRIRALEVAEAEIDRKLMQLQNAEADLEATIALASSAAEDDLAQLTAVYENMKPTEAAELFEEMAPDFAAGFLGRMRPESAATILAGLEPSTAYAISVIVAGRNANVPTD